MSWPASRPSRRIHRSTFLTGFLAAVFQPLTFHARIHLVIPSRTYVLSVYSATWDERSSASNAAIAAIISMRLLVVSGAPPDISRSFPRQRKMAPQPPGPGFPRHAPSVNISTASRFAISIQSVRAGGLHAGMETQPLQIFQRILARNQRAFRGEQPIIETGQQEPHRRATGEDRQGSQLRLA